MAFGCSDTQLASGTQPQTSTESVLVSIAYLAGLALWNMLLCVLECSERIESWLMRKTRLGTK